MANEENQYGSSTQDRGAGSATDDLNVSLYWPAESSDAPPRLRGEPANRSSRDATDEGSQVVGRTAALQASLRSLGARIDTIGGHVEELVTWAQQQRHLTDDLRLQLESLRHSDQTDPRPILDALARIEALAEAIAESQPEPIDLTSVHETLGRLEQRPNQAAIDLTSVHETLGRLEQRPNQAAIDLAPTHDALTRLEELVEAVAESQSEPMDPSPALRDLTQAVQQATERAVDEAVLEKVTALASQLDAVHERVSNRERPMAALDPATVDALADAVVARLRTRAGRADRPLRGSDHPEG